MAGLVSILIYSFDYDIRVDIVELLSYYFLLLSLVICYILQNKNNMCTNLISNFQIIFIGYQKIKFIVQSFHQMDKWFGIFL